MDLKDLEALRVKWTAEENPEDGIFELKPCFMEFRRVGRYIVKFGNQGFDTAQFGEFVPRDENGRKRCRFQSYVTEPDVAYYDAEVKLESRPAYDIMLLARDFYDDAAFVDLDEAVGRFFDALERRNAAAASKEGVKSFDTATGEIVFDANAITGSLIFDLKLTPAA